VKCTWTPNTTLPSPHEHKPRNVAKHTLDTILDHIGGTPMVRINKITQQEGIKCELYAKCEFFNAGGSVKDRIGKRMVEDAEKSGRIKPGDTLIEPTSGNTGIGLALAAAIKGYRMIITLPEKMSQEKVNILKALGAEIIRTPTEAAWDSPESHIGVAQRLNREIPNSHILDQYANPSNPLAHYDGTAEEIYEQMEGKLDAIVISAGTGGTITGIARKLKEKLPNLRVIGVDPVGSILALPESLNSGPIAPYQVEGIGYDFIPAVLDRGLIDEWLKSEDTPSFQMSRRLIKEEGLLCGGSSGSAMHAAIQFCKTMPAGSRVAVILPDSVRNYMTKFLSDDWMIDNGFLQPQEEDKPAWSDKAVGCLELPSPVTVLPTLHVKDAIHIMRSGGYDQLPVVDESSNILGVVTEGNLTALLTHGRAKPADSVSSVLYKKFRQVTPATTLAELARIFDREPYALVITSQKCVSTEGSEIKTTEKRIVTAVVTRIDLLNYISKSN